MGLGGAAAGLLVGHEAHKVGKSKCCLMVPRTPADTSLQRRSGMKTNTSSNATKIESIIGLIERSTMSEKMSKTSPTMLRVGLVKRCKTSRTFPMMLPVGPAAKWVM